MKISFIKLIPIIFLASSMFANAQSQKLIDAIHKVESGGRKDLNIKGDFNKETKVFRAIGPFQIHRAYHKDAIEYDKSIGGKYEDCFNYDYSKKIVIAYMKRYSKFHNNSDELMARLHNGGIGGIKNPERTNNYWKKVQKYLVN